MAAQRELHELLEEEYFLSKVLVFLIDDGLHECRRVCRFWRDVCAELPVHLGRIPPNRRQLATDRFPRAASLATTLTPDTARSALTSWTRLQRLELDLESDRRAPLPALNTVFHSLHRLTSLEVNLRTEPSALTSLFAALRCLPNLITLSVLSIHDAKISIPPLTEHHEIRDLEIDLPLLTNRSGAFMFPSLTQLKRLSLRVLDSKELYSVLPYIKSIHQLSLWFHTGSRHAHDMSFLKEFEKLEGVSIGGAAIDEASFVDALKKLELKQLKLKTRNLWSASLTESLGRMTGLTKLAVTTDAALQLCLDAMRQLRQLEIDIQTPVQLGSCRNLTELKIWQRGENLMDWNETLPHLSRLESLSIRADPAPLRRFPSASLAQLARLRMLSLSHVALDAEIFEILSGLCDMTSLCFHACRGLDEEMMVQVNALTQLHELRISGSDSVHPCRYILDRQLIHLRYFKSSFPRFSAEDVMELMKRLPSLRRLC